MPSTPRARPELYALSAAILNGTLGSWNRLAFRGGASYHEIAFLKCFFAFLVVLALCAVDPGRRRQVVALRHQAARLAVLAFLGMFSLYYLETWAFKEASIPVVSFLTYAAGGVTILLSALCLGERIGLFRALAFGLIVGGVWMIFSHEADVSGSPLGIALALLAGLGYALFIFVSKLWRMGSGLAHLAWLFGLGSLYLLVPVLLEGFSWPGLQAGAAIAGMVLLPTIGGFYFTTRAVHTGPASSVQIIETSDPLFATLFAFALFGDRLTPAGWAGAACIMAGLLLALRRVPSALPRPAHG